MRKVLQVFIWSWKGAESWILNVQHVEIILTAIIVLIIFGFLSVFGNFGCATNTLYDAQGTGVYTVLFLASSALRILKNDHEQNQQGLLDLTTRYQVDIQTAFNVWASETRKFLQTVIALRRAIEVEYESGRAVPGESTPETERVIQELDKVLEQVVPSLNSDIWEQG